MNSMGKINPPLRPFHNFLRKKLTLMYMQIYLKKKPNCNIRTSPLLTLTFKFHFKVMILCQ